IAHGQVPPWPLSKAYSTQLTCGVHSAKHAKKAWNLTKRSVPKRIWLRFSVKTDAPPPFEVHWQVINTGSEASQASGLRGGFYSGEGAGGIVRWETTSYRGTHLVEAFVLRSGQCVSRSGQMRVQIR